jgi:hypothetical protein
LKCNADQAISGGNTLSWLPNPDLPFGITTRS